MVGRAPRGRGLAVLWWPRNGRVLPFMVRPRCYVGSRVILICHVLMSQSTLSVGSPSGFGVMFDTMVRPARPITIGLDVEISRHSQGKLSADLEYQRDKVALACPRSREQNVGAYRGCNPEIERSQK